MPNDTRNFLSLVAAGEVDLEDFAEHRAEWRRTHGIEYYEHQFIGVSWKEYNLFLDGKVSLEELSARYGGMREVIARVQHEIWSHWMKHFLSCCREKKDHILDFSDKYPYDPNNDPHGLGPLPTIVGEETEMIIPAHLVERWRRLMTIPYAKLTEEEQQSDLEQADKVLAVLKHRNIR